MNLYYYLYYRFSNVLDKKGNNEWGPIGALTFFPLINFGVIYINVFPVTEENFNNGHKLFLIIFAGTVFILNSILFLNKKRRNKIKSHYKLESKKNRINGQIVLTLYVATSLILIFFA
jgi:hypothetical protein